jgi:hypothetical protein
MLDMREIKFINNNFENMTKDKYYCLFDEERGVYYKENFVDIYVVVDDNNCLARFTKDNFELEEIKDRWCLLKEFIKSTTNSNKVTVEDSCHYQAILNKMCELEHDICNCKNEKRKFDKDFYMDNNGLVLCGFCLNEEEKKIFRKL